VRGLLGSNRESIKHLATATGISLSTLNRRLLGKSSFTIDELFAISNHFSVPVNKIAASLPVFSSPTSTPTDLSDPALAGDKEA
jgi:transcriptional regulator with XRE-family HTH domain